MPAGVRPETGGGQDPADRSLPGPVPEPGRLALDTAVVGCQNSATGPDLGSMRLVHIRE
jgi:hypothetical protein